jgi:hypothetical protein
MTKPNNTLLDEGLPTLILGGVRWPVPLLAPKQNRVVVPILLEMIPKITASYQTIMMKDEAGNEVERSVADLEQLALVLTEGGIDKLTRCIYHALKKGHNELTLDEVEDMPIGTFEMIDAIMTIARQTGIMRAARNGEKAVGEAAAASP